MDAIDDVDIGVPSFCGVLISNEVSHLFPNCLTSDLIGMTPLCLCGILRVDLTIPIVAFC